MGEQGTSGAIKYNSHLIACQIVPITFIHTEITQS